MDLGTRSEDLPLPNIEVDWVSTIGNDGNVGIPKNRWKPSQQKSIIVGGLGSCGVGNYSFIPIADTLCHEGRTVVGTYDGFIIWKPMRNMDGRLRTLEQYTCKERRGMWQGGLSFLSLALYSCFSSCVQVLQFW